MSKNGDYEFIPSKLLRMRLRQFVGPFLIVNSDTDDPFIIFFNNNGSIIFEDFSIVVIASKYGRKIN